MNDLYAHLRVLQDPDAPSDATAQAAQAFMGVVREQARRVDACRTLDPDAQEDVVAGVVYALYERLRRGAWALEATDNPKAYITTCLHNAAVKHRNAGLPPRPRDPRPKTLAPDTTTARPNPALDPNALTGDVDQLRDLSPKADARLDAARWPERVGELGRYMEACGRPLEPFFEGWEAAVEAWDTLWRRGVEHIAARTRSDGSANFCESITELHALAMGETSMDALVSQALERASAPEPPSPAERRRVASRIHKQHQRARERVHELISACWQALPQHERDAALASLNRQQAARAALYIARLRDAPPPRKAVAPLDPLPNADVILYWHFLSVVALRQRMDTA